MARRIGFKDLHIALVTTNTETEYTASEPVKFMKAISGKTSTKRSSEKIYSDDTIEDIVSSFDGVDVEFEGDQLSHKTIAMIISACYESGFLVENKDDQAQEVDIVSSFDGVDVEFEGDQLSHKTIAMIISACYESGFLVENKDDQAQEVAIGYRAKMSNGKYEFIWYYCGKFDGDDEDEFETEGEKPSPKTKTVKGSFYARKKDGNYRIRVMEDELLESHTDAKAAIENWFSKVQEKSGAGKSRVSSK